MQNQTEMIRGEVREGGRSLQRAYLFIYLYAENHQYKYAKKTIIKKISEYYTLQKSTDLHDCHVGA